MAINFFCFGSRIRPKSTCGFILGLFPRKFCAWHKHSEVSERPIVNLSKFKSDLASLILVKRMLPILEPLVKCFIFFGFKSLLRWFLKSGSVISCVDWNWNWWRWWVLTLFSVFILVHCKKTDFNPADSHPDLYGKRSSYILMVKKNTYYINC